MRLGSCCFAVEQCRTSYAKDWHEPYCAASVSVVVIDPSLMCLILSIKILNARGGGNGSILPTSCSCAHYAVTEM